MSNHKTFSTPLITLLIALIINAVGHSYFVMTFPAWGRKINLSDFQTGLILSLSALILTIATPVWGIICEKWGRRKTISAGFFASFLFILLLAAVIYSRLHTIIGIFAGFYLVLSTRLLHAATTASIMPSAQAIIADVTDPKMRLKGMGLLGAAFGIGTLGGGLMAMATGGKHIVEGFVLIALLLFVFTLLIFLFLPETQQVSRSHQAPARSLQRILPYFLTTLIGLTVYSSLQQVTALRLQDSFGLTIHESIRFTGAIMMTSMVAMIITQSVGVNLFKQTPQKLILGGALLAALSMCLGAFAPTTVVLLIAMVLLGIGLGAMLPANLASLSLAVSNQQQAKVAGLNGTFQGIGLALGPMLGVAMHRISPSSTYILNAVLLALILVLVWMSRLLHAEYGKAT